MSAGSAAAPISAVLAPISLAALRVSTSPRPAATSAPKGISAVGVSWRGLAAASMVTTTGAAPATRTTHLTSAIRPPLRPRTTSRRHRTAITAMPHTNDKPRIVVAGLLLESNDLRASPAGATFPHAAWPRPIRQEPLGSVGLRRERRIGQIAAIHAQ